MSSRRPSGGGSSSVSSSSHARRSSGGGAGDLVRKASSGSLGGSSRRSSGASTGGSRRSSRDETHRPIQAWAEEWTQQQQQVEEESRPPRSAAAAAPEPEELGHPYGEGGGDEVAPAEGSDSFEALERKRKLEGLEEEGPPVQEEVQPQEEEYYEEELPPEPIVKKLRWSDDHGYALAEIHYCEKLHYGEDTYVAEQAERRVAQSSACCSLM